MCFTDLPEKRLIVGIGNLLREDDAVGILLMRRLRDHFGSALQCLEVYAPDILMAETFSQMDHVLLIDAMKLEEEVPFRLIPIEASDAIAPSPGFAAHAVDWQTILGMAKAFYGHSPKMDLLAVRASCFSFSESLSEECAANADEAFSFLVEFCS